MPSAANCTAPERHLPFILSKAKRNMKHRTKLNSDQELQVETGQTQQQAPAEFETAEELLRFDASRIAVPPSIAERLQESIRSHAETERPWCKRCLAKK